MPLDYYTDFWINLGEYSMDILASLRRYYMYFNTYSGCANEDISNCGFWAKFFCGYANEDLSINYFLGQFFPVSFASVDISDHIQDPNEFNR